jgi:hypothetical protein
LASLAIASREMAAIAPAGLRVVLSLTKSSRRGRIAPFANSKSAMFSDVKSITNDLDELVYALYGLTEKEKAMVKGTSK